MAIPALQPKAVIHHDKVAGIIRCPDIYDHTVVDGGDTSSFGDKILNALVAEKDAAQAELERLYQRWEELSEAAGEV